MRGDLGAGAGHAGRLDEGAARHHLGRGRGPAGDLHPAGVDGQGVGHGLVDQIVRQLVDDERTAELEGDLEGPLGEGLGERLPGLVERPHVPLGQHEFAARIGLGRQHGAGAGDVGQDRDPRRVQHRPAADVGRVRRRAALDQHRVVPVRLGRRGGDVVAAAVLGAVGQPTAGFLARIGVAIDGAGDEPHLGRWGRDGRRGGQQQEHRGGLHSARIRFTRSCFSCSE